MQTLVKNEKVQALLEQVKQGVANIRNSEDWKRSLEANAKFWKYSFRNQILITLQRPTATRVAGYHTWLKLGRHVKRGEHGISILAPLLAKKEDKESKEVKTVIRGFRSASVFDLSQTEGDELPTVYHPLVGEAPEGVFAKAKQFIEAKGYLVQFQVMPDGEYGYVDINNRIALKDGVATAQTLTTLIHEISHALLGHLKDKEASRERKELEAETTSWIVCKNLGLETDQSSFAYLAIWSPSVGRDKMLEEAAQRASTMAKQILEGLDVRGKEAIEDNELP